MYTRKDTDICSFGIKGEKEVREHTVKASKEDRGRECVDAELPKENFGLPPGRTHPMTIPASPVTVSHPAVLTTLSTSTAVGSVTAPP